MTCNCCTRTRTRAPCMASAQARTTGAMVLNLHAMRHRMWQAYGVSVCQVSLPYLTSLTRKSIGRGNRWAAVSTRISMLAGYIGSPCFFSNIQFLSAFFDPFTSASSVSPSVGDGTGIPRVRDACVHRAQPRHPVEHSRPGFHADYRRSQPGCSCQLERPALHSRL